MTTCLMPIRLSCLKTNARKRRRDPSGDSGDPVVDEFRLMVNPVAIGKGTPLFAGLTKQVKLNLINSRVFKNGNVLNRHSN